MKISSLEKSVIRGLQKEAEERAKEALAESRRVAKIPNLEKRLQVLFPSVFDGHHDLIYAGVQFQVHNRVYTIRREHYSDPGTPTEGYPPTEGWNWVLSRGYNVEQLATFSDYELNPPPPEDIALSNQRLAEYIQADLKRS